MARSSILHPRSSILDPRNSEPMNAALKNIETALSEHYGWSSSPALREKIGAAVEVKAERVRAAAEEHCRIPAPSLRGKLALVEEVSPGETRLLREPPPF